MWSLRVDITTTCWHVSQSGDPSIHFPSLVAACGIGLLFQVNEFITLEKIRQLFCSEIISDFSQPYLVTFIRFVITEITNKILIVFQSFWPWSHNSTLTWQKAEF